MPSSAFFTLHADLPREGPGEPADVAWAARIAGIAPDARICDAACGPGADIPALLAAAPQGHVTAIDATAHFVTDAQVHAGPNVTVRQGDMADLDGPFDMIWCAGALYFLGVTEGLIKWREALVPGGVVAFSEPCWFTDTPTETSFWEGYDTGTEAQIAARVADAGYETLATRRLSDAAWEAYYTPMDARIAALRESADAELNKVLDEGVKEAADWRRLKQDTGYLLCVVRPR